MAGYDPTDMVVDMDMSDEDLDDIFRGLLIYSYYFSLVHYITSQKCLFLLFSIDYNFYYF